METTYPLPRTAQRTSSLSALLLPLAIILVALLPRVLNLGLFATMDEVNFWFARSELFLNAIRSGNFGATAITDHPGVTTMWLGASSLVLRDTLAAWGLLGEPTPQISIALFELPAAVVNALAVGAGYLLLQGMLPRSVALLGALLWALDPFVIGYSRVLHVDGLSGTWMMLSVIAACRYWFYSSRRSDLAISAITAALAIVTKSPALILAPTVGGIALAANWGQGGRLAYRLLIRSLVGWGLITVIVAIIVWPALWAAPLAAFEQIRIGYSAEGTQPHQTGNFFLGRFDAAPGLLFYPVAIALRLTPITLIGLLVLPLAWRRMELAPEARRSLAGMAWFALLLTFALSLFAKKFNRYIVPVFPALDLLAAIGLIWLSANVAPWLVRRAGWIKREVVQFCAVGAVVLATVANTTWWHPYHIVAFNQLLGGAPAGARAFSAGWGEGMNLVADWLNQQPNITGVLTVTTLKTGLQTYLRPGVQSVTPPRGPLPPKTGYVVVYLHEAQMGPPSAPFDQFYGKLPALETIRIHGVDYAWIYEAPPAIGRSITATFGAIARIYGITAPDNPRPGTTLGWSIVWQPQPTLPNSTMLFAHLLGPNGVRYAQLDVPYPPAGSVPNRYMTMGLPLSLPPDAPPGAYRLVIGMYTPDGSRLPLESAAADPALDGPDALLLDEISVAP